MVVALYMAELSPTMQFQFTVKANIRLTNNYQKHIIIKDFINLKIYNCKVIL